MNSAIMQTIMFCGIVLVAVQASTTSSAGRISASTNSRMLTQDLMRERHTIPPPDFSAADAFPLLAIARQQQTLPQQQSVALQAPAFSCVPEADGYFGGTAGQPVGLQYGFVMETAIHGNRTAALSAVDSAVADAILSRAFPEVCGDMRRLTTQDEQGRPTGFRFRQERIDMSRSCVATGNSLNYCAVYSSVVLMYGRDLEPAGAGEVVLGYIRDTIESSLSDLMLKYQVVRLQMDEPLTRAIYSVAEAVSPTTAGFNGGGSGTNDAEYDSFSGGALAGLVIFSLALVASIAGFVLYNRMDKKKAGLATKRNKHTAKSARTFLERFRAAQSNSEGPHGTDSDASSNYGESVNNDEQHHLADTNITATNSSTATRSSPMELEGGTPPVLAAVAEDDEEESVYLTMHLLAVDSMVDSIAHDSSSIEGDSVTIPGDDVYLEAIVD